MKSNELLPFIRNRYYKGKMLTSSDFEAEQTYMNNKRRFINQMIGGSGIACGLNVVSLDDLSIMIESGMAVDLTGREIVLESSVVKKLSAITGFEKLKTDKASLCIRYNEKEIQPVYAINRQTSEEEYEFNRIEDDYELFLADSEIFDNDFEVESEFFVSATLFENNDYRVTVKLPANICAGHYVKLDVDIEKLSDERAVLYYEGVLQTPALTSLDNSQEINIILDSISLEYGQKIKKEYWMLAQTEEISDTSIMLKNSSARALVNGIEESVNYGVNCKISIVDESPVKLAAREAARTSMEFRRMGLNNNCIRLADLTLVRTETAYLIESVEEKGIRKYIPTLCDEWKRTEYEQYFGKKLPFYDSKKERNYGAGEEDHIEYKDNKGPKIETGIVEIPLGENARKGDICYSGEIMHGLGKGNVYVEVGYEYLEENQLLGMNTKTTIYGNPELFSDGRPEVAAETAVKVLNDKGSFVVALKLLQNVEQLVLTYRWVAIRYDGDKVQEELESNNSQSISAVTPTIVLGTKDSYFFQVKYNNMKACSVSYELTEPGSGEITSDGIYTAPSKEGVYEIRIYCTDKPLICTYAYAIVKKKTAEEMTE